MEVDVLHHEVAFRGDAVALSLPELVALVVGPGGGDLALHGAAAQECVLALFHHDGGAEGTHLGLSGLVAKVAFLPVG